MPPTALIFATCMDWVAPPRVAAALRARGLQVVALAPTGADLLLSCHLHAGSGYDLAQGSQALLPRLAQHLLLHQPALVLPGDDAAFFMLAALAAQQAVDSPLHRLLSPWLPAPQQLPLSLSKTRFLQAATLHGLRCPPTAYAPDPALLPRLMARLGRPLVIKLDRGWGGSGVQLVHDPADAVRLAQALRGSRWAVQQHVAGTPAHVALSCHQGEVLAAAAFSVLAVAQANGPATVLQPIAHPEMLAQAGQAVRLCGLSGLAGVDFMLDTQNTPWLLEVNPRMLPATRACEALGQDLVGTLLARLALPHPPAAARPAAAPAGRVEASCIALFPNEQLRQPDSPYLGQAWQDLPWDDPPLMAAWQNRLPAGTAALQPPPQATASAPWETALMF